MRDAIAESCRTLDEAGGSYDGRGHSPYYGFDCLDVERAIEFAYKKSKHSSV